MLGINTNVTSLTAQRNLSGTTSSMQTTLQRLSSGLRINSAKDDAAGLAISERMTAQVRGLDQARRNANDGISLSQTAESGMASASEMLQRMRELAVQAANDTNTADDRKAMQAEVTQLKQELNRLVDTTQFNGKNVLDGSLNNAQFQVGANAQQTIGVSIGSIRGDKLGNYQATVQGSTGSAGLGQAVVGTTAGTPPGNGVVGSAGGFTISGQGQTKSIDIGTNASAKDLAAAINGLSSNTGVKADATTTATLSRITGGTVTFDLTGDNASAVKISATVSGGLKSLVDALNDQSASTGISAKLNDAGEVELTSKSGADIKIASYTNSAAGTNDTMTIKGAAGGTSNIVEGGTGNSATISGTLSLNSSTAFTLSGTGTSVLAQGTAGASSGLQSIDSLDIGTTAGANSALKMLDAALSTVNSRRADLGALQNRFSNTISSLQSTSENLSASRSRILDADFANETANLSRNQVLQQAGTAMLAQANQSPQIALQLLR
ncbi:flagellin [Laribacter hongkongensis]|uniref:flagellin N-terminal helical domain-containing protein n=1 Tax=Laribacter hongkongensis TaxID=168471 RepID=UPI001EFD6006|nr:flagellin [Laribacter hongkongensis]MCG9064510.1 flagellin [Laribacter hongkongensis]